MVSPGKLCKLAVVAQQLAAKLLGGCKDDRVWQPQRLVTSAKRGCLLGNARSQRCHRDAHGGNSLTRIGDTPGAGESHQGLAVGAGRNQ